MAGCKSFINAIAWGAESRSPSTHPLCYSRLQHSCSIEKTFEVLPAVADEEDFLLISVFCL